jgi:hypothetical protein
VGIRQVSSTGGNGRPPPPSRRRFGDHDLLAGLHVSLKPGQPIPEILHLVGLLLDQLPVALLDRQETVERP